MRSSRSIILAPMTVGVVWAACFLYVAVLFLMNEHTRARNPLVSSQRDLGASVELTNFQQMTRPTKQVELIPRESGPLDLWDGELWRVPINALHHGNLLHLLMNGCALLFMGKIIEPRLGKLRTLLFYLIAAAVTGIVPALFNISGVGLSGVVYAQVGLLMVWRDRDEQVAEEFPYSMVVFAGIWLVGCQLVTYADILPVDNAAHYSGLVYGWLFAQVYLISSNPLLPRFLFAAGHVFLIPAFWFAMNPFWSGNWHWYRSRGPDVSADQRLERLQAAVLYDPTLAGAWNELTIELLRRNDDQAAFRVALEGLRHNPDDAELMNKIVTIWTDARLDSRSLEADRFISQTFAEDAEPWKEKLHSQVDPLVNRMQWKWEDLEKLAGLRPVREPDLPVESRESFSAPQPDPDAPDSALGGMTM